MSHVVKENNKELLWEGGNNIPHTFRFASIEDFNSFTDTNNISGLQYEMKGGLDMIHY